MSALRDRDFPVHFYYGNATQDLAHLMPIEDEAEISLENRLNSLDQLISKIDETQEKLSFYLRDILRLK